MTEEELVKVTKELTTAVEARLTEMREVRTQLPALEASAGPADLVDALAAARRVVDSLEAGLTQLMLWHIGLRNLLEVVRGELEDSEMEAVRTTRHGEYVSAKERTLTLKLATLEDTRKARIVERAERKVYGSLEVARVVYRAAENNRRDLDTRLRALTLITSLERG